jgi:hypothetical protein
VEIYVLNSLLQHIEVIDEFISFIWTERFKKVGDFQLVMNATSANRRKLPTGTRLAIEKSKRVMTVETIEDSTDAEGVATLTFTGRSLEYILDNRLARGALADLTFTPKWVLEGTPTEIARQIFHDVCVTGVLDAGDIIPGVNESSIFPEDTIDEPTDEVVVEIEPTSVLNAESNLADIYDFGFRLVRDTDTQLYFDVYMGSDRTTRQAILPAVVFSDDMDNLANSTELTSIALYKNVAYVLSPAGHEIVYPDDVDPEIEGFERNVLIVKADDIAVDDLDASAKMIQRGKNELAKARRFTAFDGEIARPSNYEYGVDFHLGDLVETRRKSGGMTTMQVTEQIFVQDSEGERDYPTLTVNTYITPGSWLWWPINEVWEDVDEEMDWDDAP